MGLFTQGVNLNKTIETFARSKILEGLKQLDSSSHGVFNCMYGYEKNLTIEQIKAKDIEKVVNEMPPEKLDWALTQVEATLTKLQKTDEPKIQNSKN